MRQKTRIRIDRLVIGGVEPAHFERVVSALRHHLSQGVPSAALGRRATVRGSLTYTAVEGAGPEAVGEGAANMILGSLTQGEGEP